MLRSFVLCLTVLGALSGQGPKLSDPRPEVVSLLGKKFFGQADQTGEIRRADAALAGRPNDIERLLAAGLARDQRLQFSGAIEMYTRAINVAPTDARPYRFRGHRYISIRRFDDAVRDLSVAAKFAPSSYDIAYHLGLALYLRGEFQRAADEFARCMNQAAGPDQLPSGWRSCSSAASDDNARVAITDWRYRALRRAGRHDEARRLLDAVTPNMQVKENQSYHQALLSYKGLLPEGELLSPARLTGNDLATLGYALGNYQLVEGRTPQACALFRRIVDSDLWNAFGFIAAEVELSRARGPCSR